jgi:hypothetical protein
MHSHRQSIPDSCAQAIPTIAGFAVATTMFSSLFLPQPFAWPVHQPAALKGRARGIPAGAPLVGALATNTLNCGST